MLLRLHGGLTTHSRSGDRLPVSLVHHVSGCVDRFQLGTHVLGDDGTFDGDDVSFFIQVEDALEKFGVRDMSDTQEHTVARDDFALHFALRSVRGCSVGVGNDLHPGNRAGLVVAHHLGDFRVPTEFDLRMLQSAGLHNLRGAEFGATVDDDHFGGKAGEEDGFFHRRVAASDDGDDLILVEGAVAGGARRHASAEKLSFTRHV